MAIRAMGPSGQHKTGLDAAGAALPELLAPAGGLDQMFAAIAAGADAIYAGLGGFNARVSAHGFTDDEFARGCAVAPMPGWPARCARRFPGSRFTCPRRRAFIAKAPCDLPPMSWGSSA